MVQVRKSVLNSVLLSINPQLLVADQEEIDLIDLNCKQTLVLQVRRLLVIFFGLE